MKPPSPKTTLTWLLATAIPTSTASTPDPTLHLIHRYPNNTALENLAVRSNGQLLLTETSGPNLYAVDPCTGSSTILTQFPNPYNTTGALGITEVQPDTFYAVVGTNAFLQGTAPISWALYRIAFTGTAQPVVTKHQDLPGNSFQNLPNGITTLNVAKGLILVADFFNGTVWRADTLRKTVSVAVRDPALANPEGGANGVKIRDGTMYVSNYAGQSLVRVPIHADGTPRGAVSALPTGYTVDDFTFDGQGRIYGATGANNSVVMFGGEGYAQRSVVANVVNSTAAEFGRGADDARCLYVTAMGALYGVDVDGVGAFSRAER